VTCVPITISPTLQLDTVLDTELSGCQTVSKKHAVKQRVAFRVYVFCFELQTHSPETQIETRHDAMRNTWGAENHSKHAKAQ
jgi:hypothetical protein